MTLDSLITRASAGEQRAVARLMSQAERGGLQADPAAADRLFALTGRAHIIGITGVPGSGKSTLVRGLAKVWRNRGLRIGIVCVDPSSPFTGGSILGDRIRMNDLAGDDGVFIRSMASRGMLGGLARATQDAVDVLDAAGYDRVLIETVGVGQDEVDITRAAHSVLVVSAPGLGDAVQAIKSGVLEIADLHAVSKSDRPDAQRTVADLKEMLGMTSGHGHHGSDAGGAAALTQDDAGWPIPVLSTSAEAGTGINELVDAIEAHRTWLHSNGRLAARNQHMLEWRMLKLAEESVRQRFLQQRAQHATAWAENMRGMLARRMHPAHAAAEWLRGATNA